MMKNPQQVQSKSLTVNFETKAVAVVGSTKLLNLARDKSLDGELYEKVQCKLESLLNRKKVTVASLNRFTRWVFVAGFMAGIEIAVKGVK